MGRRKAFSTGDLAGGVDRATRIVLVAPASDGIEILQAKSNRIEDLVAVGADGIRAVQLGALAQGEVGDLRVVLFFQSGHVRRSGRDVFPEHLFEHPHPAFDGAGAMGKRGRRQYARHAQNPAPVGIGQLHPAHGWAGDGFFETINFRQSLVEESVVAIDETDHAPVFAHDAVEEEPRLIIHRGAQFAGHLRKFDRIESLAREFANSEPLRPESIEQRA